MSLLFDVKKEIIKTIAQKTGLELTPDEIITPEPERGDLALPCFRLSKEQKKSPTEIAQTLAKVINKITAKAEAVGPYVNIHIKREELANKLITRINKEGEKYGDNSIGKGKKILLEYVSPNTNKPLHLGHLRNAVLGWGLAKLLGTQGYKVIKAQIINDRGIHIMKSLLAYERWGNNETPQSARIKGDHLVGKYYVKFTEEAKKNPDLDSEAQEYLQRWEQGDKNLQTLWKKLNGWVEEGMEETYARLGISFDRVDHESEIYENGRKIVEQAVKDGLAVKKSDGAIAINLTDEGLEEKILLRQDGTTVYITQDLYLAQKRLKDTKAELLIYVVGQEQDYHFKVLFSILERLGIADKKQLKHLSYHWVFLPEGRMKSREGTVVDADNLLNELQTLAENEIKKRVTDIKKNELQKRAEIIALSAAKFYLLIVRPNSDIKFNPEESMAFSGRTGPYLLYTLARIKSIFRKAETIKHIPKIKTVSEAEWQLVLSLARFSDELERAAKLYDPSLVAEYAYELTRSITTFYENEPVLKAEPETRAWRLNLLKASDTVLEKSLILLGLTPLEKM